MTTKANQEKFGQPPMMGSMRGLSLLELMVVVTVVLAITAISVPQFMQTLYNAQLRSAANEVADLVQRARMSAARANATYPIRFQMNGSLQQAYIDLNGNGALDTNEPFIDLPQNITAASGAPSGSGGQPTAYTLVGDTSSGTPYTNTNVLAYSPRGLPCEYSTPPTCSTPASTYFVFYFTSSRSGMWAAVLVTKSGRSKAMLWNGAAWK